MTLPTSEAVKLTPLLAELPLGDGPKRTHIHLRKALSSIARRVAMKALAAGREDILLEVYAAGLSHAAALALLEAERERMRELRVRLLYIANSYDLGADTELFERVIEDLAALTPEPKP